MCACVHVYIHVHACVCAGVHVCTHVCACVCVHACACVCMCACMCARVHACVRMHVHACMCVCARMHTHVCVMLSSLPGTEELLHNITSWPPPSPSLVSSIGTHGIGCPLTAPKEAAAESSLLPLHDARIPESACLGMSPFCR